MLIFLLTALAAEPVVEIQDDSWIDGRIVVAASIEAVSEVLSSPRRIAEIDGAAVTVHQTPDGDCFAVVNDVSHPIASLSYETRACPEGEGTWRTKLTGGQMKEFESVWTAKTVDGGVHIGIRSRSVTNMMVPQWVINRSAAKSVIHTLEALRDHLEGTSVGDPEVR